MPQIKTVFTRGLAASALAICAALPSWADNVLRIGQTGALPNLNPYILAGPYDSMVNNVFDVLTRYDSDLTPQPRLAESWSFSEDGKTMTLKLRQGVKFHSGREFTSADVKFSLDYVNNADNGALIRNFASRIVDLQTPDDQTVVLSFEAPFPAVFDLLELFFIVDSETSSDFSVTAVGTGPYSVSEHMAGTKSVFARFDDYWGGTPGLDGFEIITTPSRQSQLLSLQGGEVDLVAGLGWVDVLPFSRNDDFIVGEAPSSTAVDISLNFKTEALQNPAVREAIDLSIDRDRVARLLFGKLGRSWCLPFNPNSLAYFEEYDNCEFDLEKAKKVLADAGVETPIELKILTSTELRPEMTTTAEIIQADLAQIGINLVIDNLDAAGYRSTYVQERAYEVASHVFGRAGKDPSSLLESTVVWRPNGNITAYDNEDYRNAVLAGGSTTDVEERRKHYKEAARIIREDRFILPVVPRIKIFVQSAGVEGLAWSADGFPLLEKAVAAE